MGKPLKPAPWAHRLSKYRSSQQDVQNMTNFNKIQLICPKKDQVQKRFQSLPKRSLKKYCSSKLHWSLFAHDWHEFQVWWVNSPKYKIPWLIWIVKFPSLLVDLWIPISLWWKKQFRNGFTIKSSCAWSNLPLCGLNLHFGLWNIVKLLQNLHMCQGQNMIDDGVFERHSIFKGILTIILHRHKDGISTLKTNME